MVDYYGNRHDEKFTYRRVRWSSFATKDEEIGEYNSFTGGNIEHGALTSVKVSGSFSYTGEAPDEVDLLRVYYTFTDDDEETSEPHALGTFVITTSTATNTSDGDGLVKSGVATGYSVLKVLNDRLCGLPLTIAAGSNPITKAAQLVKSCGLRVNYPKGTTYRLKASHTFEPDESFLSVVNWLLSNCSTQYRSASVDGYGVVQIQKYEDPSSKTPTHTFRDDANSIMLPEVNEDSDIQTSENVVRLYYEDDSVAMWASAANVSGTPSSLNTRGGREVSLYEYVDEIEDLDALKALAASRLQDSATGYEHVSFVHAFVPISTGDAVSVEYADATWSGTVQTMRVSLTPSAQTRTELRRFVSAAMQVETDGAVLWTAGE